VHSTLTGSPEFNVASETCTSAGSLDHGEKCAVTVTYLPAVVGDTSASLQLLTDSPNSPFETLTINGTGTLPPVPPVPPVLTKANLLVAQSGKAVRLPHGKIKVVVKGYFPIPSGALGSDLCLNTATLNGALPGGKKKIVAHGMLGWFDTRCAVSFSLRLPANVKRKKLAVDFHIGGNAAVAPGDAHAEVKIK
jgi:hypothetical protein